MFGFGGSEIALIFLIILLIFGPSQITRDEAPTPPKGPGDKPIN